MPPPLDICHVTSAFIGGTFNSVRQLANGQADRGHKVMVVYNDRGPLPAGYAALFGHDVQLVPWTVRREVAPYRDIIALLRLLRLLAAKRPSILHLHCSKAGLIGRVAARLMALPAVYSPRGLPFYRTDTYAAARWLFRRLEWLAGRFGGLAVACSHDEQAGLAALGIRNMLIPNSVALDEVDAAVAAMSGAASAAPTGPFHVVMSGRIVPARSPELVARLVLAAPASWRWTWLGDGPLRHVVEDTGRVTVAGWLSRADTLAAIRTADVLLHASAWEGMPMAVLEAMAVARPVVASNIVGNRDLVQDGVTGYLVGDESGYLPALERLAGDRALGYRLGRMGRQVVETCYSTEQRHEEWLQTYQGEIARRHARSPLQLAPPAVTP